MTNKTKGLVGMAVGLVLLVIVSVTRVPSSLAKVAAGPNTDALVSQLSNLSSYYKGLASKIDALLAELSGAPSAGSATEVGGIGGAAGPNVQNSQWDFTRGIRVGLAQQFTLDKLGNATSTGGMSVGPWFDQNGVNSVVVSGTFNPASTTAFCTPNPFATTSTADYAQIKNTGISTTSVAFIIATTTQTIATNGGLTTSTLGFGFGGKTQLLAVNLINPTSATNTIYVGTGTTDSRSGQNTQTATSIPVGPLESICGVIGEGNGGNTAGITNATTSLWAGTYLLHFRL